MNNNKTLKCDIEINIDNIIETKPFKKPKGWGHWNNFIKSDEYTKLIPGKIEITEEELSKHNKPGDMWIGLLHDKRICVFDVTHFADYHPGGYELIKAVAGRDATQDFRVAHAYVNPNMIARFQKGYLVRSQFKSPNSLSPGMSLFPPVRKVSAKKPRWDWTETGDIVTLTFYLHKIIPQKLNCVSVLCAPQDNFKLRIFFEVEYYHFEIKLFDFLSPILDSLECHESGKSISINLKNVQGRAASTLGGIVEDSMISLTDYINKDEYLPCSIIKTNDLNHNCREFTIRWPVWARIGIPLGHHIVVQGSVNNNIVQRPYTPVCVISPSVQHQSNQMIFDEELILMIKRYNDGQLTPFIHSLKTNDSINVSLPMGVFKTLSWLSIESGFDKKFHNDIKSVVCLAAGSGITPMIRMIQAFVTLENVNCHLLFFNKTQSDIIYSNEFEVLAELSNNNFKVTHILSDPDSEWKGFTGRISESLFQKIVVENFAKRYYMICGPSAFNKNAVEILTSLKIELDNIFEFKG